ncbi:MAG: type II toxin-antitoxin system RelE family toxin [Terriglobia bacterium]
MNWEIRYRASVEKDVDRLPTHIRVLVLRKIVGLGENPFPLGCKKLRGNTDRYRVKVARDWRIVYSLFREFNLIKIEFVGHRKDAYRWF